MRETPKGRQELVEDCQRVLEPYWVSNLKV